MKESKDFCSNDIQKKEDGPPVFGRWNLVKRVWERDGAILAKSRPEDSFQEPGKNRLARSLGNLLKAAVWGYGARLRVLPDVPMNIDDLTLVSQESPNSDETVECMRRFSRISAIRVM